MTTTLSDLMRKNVFTIRDTTSNHNSKEMNNKKVISLRVVDSNGKAKGLITERDLDRKVCTNNVRTSELKNL